MVRGSATPRRPRPTLAIQAGSQGWDPSSKVPRPLRGSCSGDLTDPWEPQGPGKLCDFPRFGAELALNTSLYFSPVPVKATIPTRTQVGDSGPRTSGSREGRGHSGRLASLCW